MNVFRTFGRGMTASTLGDGTANLGEMNFAFIDMGQGDCTIISDPDNHVFIVDCGTASMTEQAHLDEAKQILRAWAGNDSVDLIATHPDHDHYNRFYELLVTPPVVDVNAIYFSRAAADNSPLGNYTINGFNNSLPYFGYPLLTEVTLNDTWSYEKTWRKANGFYTIPESTDIPDAGYIIGEGTTDNNKDWSVTIIAGNVQTVQNPASATANNVVSLCTIFKFDQDKLFLTGDSTEETLTYLYDYQRNHFRNCSIFQVPHHGSESSLPTVAFKDHVNPETLIVSVGFASYVHKHPREDVLDVWLTCSRLRTIDDREYDEWVYGVEGYNNTNDLNEILTEDWEDYEVLRTNTFFRLADPDLGSEAGTDFWGFTSSFYFIYRRAVTKDIYLTGLYGNLINQSFSAAPGESNQLSTNEDHEH